MRATARRAYPQPLARLGEKLPAGEPILDRSWIVTSPIAQASLFSVELETSPN
jgi:hypothetical protein